MNILYYKVGGIDLSLTGTGVCSLHSGPLNTVTDSKPFIITEATPRFNDVKTSLIKSKKDGDTPTDEIARMVNIIKDIDVFFNGFKGFNLIAIEGVSYMSKNTTSISQLSGLSYMLRRLFLEANVPFLVVAPSTLKKFTTGSGNAKKDMMLLEAYKKYGVSFSDDNECDAFCLMKLAELYYVRKIEKLTKIEEETFKLLDKQKVCL